jgi:pyruvate kinase
MYLHVKLNFCLILSLHYSCDNQIDYDEAYNRIRQQSLISHGPMTPSESVASSAVKTAFDVKAKFIVVLSETGNTARLIAKYRPSMPILVVTTDEAVARQCNGYMNSCHSEVVPSMLGTDVILLHAIESGKKLGWCKSGDSIVCVHGSAEGTSGSTNLLRVYTA